MKRIPFFTILVLTGILALTHSPTSINKPNHPDSITINPVQMNINAGGRAVAVTVNPAYSLEAIVASESGGLWRTTNGGDSWSRIASLKMFRITDVAYAPSSPPGQTIVIAIGYADGHNPNTGTLWRSTNNGVDWSQPDLDPGPGDPTHRPCREIYSAYSLSFQGSTGRVYIGTDCGVAFSQDWGANWQHHTLFNPWGRTEPIHSVAAQPSTGVSVCSDFGYRFAPNLEDFGGYSNPPSSHGCSSSRSLAISPLQPDVVYLTNWVDNPPGERGICNALFENTNNGAATWNRISDIMCSPGSRAPWVYTILPRSVLTADYEIYFGSSYRLIRNVCSQGSTDPRCNSTGWQELTGGQTDRNGLAFNSTSHCPMYQVTDGGIERPVDRNNASTCGSAWRTDGIPSTGYSALQIYDMASTRLPEHVDLYAGLQDNGIWASADGGVSWPNGCGVEGGFLQVAPTALIHDGLYVTYRGFNWNNNAMTYPHFGGCPESGQPWPADLIWHSPSGVRNFHAPMRASLNPTGQTYVQWNEAITGTYQLNSTYNKSLDWIAVTSSSIEPFLPPQISIADDRVIVYQAYLRGWLSSGDENFGLRRISGLDVFGNLTYPVTTTLADSDLGSIGSFCLGEGTFVCPLTWGVDRRNPNNLLAADIGEGGSIGGGPGSMKISLTGGVSWNTQTQLTSLVTNGGEYRLYIPRDQVRDEPTGSRTQVHAIAYNPLVRNHILVSTETLGIFQSYNGGTTWEPITGTEQIPAISSFSFLPPGADHRLWFYVSTYGRGAWKVGVPREPRPYNVRGDFEADWSTGTILDAYTPGIFYRPLDFDVPGPCLACGFFTLPYNSITDMQVDMGGTIQWMKIDGGHFIGSDALGEAIPSKLPALITTVNKPADAYDGCPVCPLVIKAGGTIRGVVLDNEKLFALIVSYGDLPWAKSVQSFDAFLPLEAEYIAPPAPPARDGPWIRLIGTQGYGGQATVGQGETVTILGSGFMQSPDCTKVEVTIDDYLLDETIVPDTKGNFLVSYPIYYPHGFYKITASQVCSGETLEDSSMLMVAILEGVTEPEEQGFIYLPFIFFKK
jgi:hypothetical protein